MSWNRHFDVVEISGVIVELPFDDVAMLGFVVEMAW
jgi:hypothetical protein